MTEHGPDTLAELAADRRDRDLPVEVHVVGYFEHDPPRGLDAARRVAELLTDDGGTVRELGDDLEAGDVVWVRIDERSFMADEKRLQIEKLSTMVRMKQLAGIVTFTHEVPPACNRFLDARVWAKSGSVDRVERLQFNPYDGETTAVELEGLGDHTDEWENDRTTFGVEENYVIRKDATPPTRAEATLFGEYQSKLGGYTDEAQKTLSDFFDPEAEWVTGRQNQQTLAAYEEHFEEDIFEANNRMRWFTFVTNRDVNEEEARALREYYHYRWAIESAFSDYKKNFLPTTKSTNLGMRVYLYLFGMTAYNAWVAANTKARRQHMEDSERNRPPIRASRFTTIGQQRYRDEFHRDYINFGE